MNESMAAAAHLAGVLRLFVAGRGEIGIVPAAELVVGGPLALAVPYEHDTVRHLASVNPRYAPGAGGHCIQGTRTLLIPHTTASVSMLVSRSRAACVHE